MKLLATAKGLLLYKKPVIAASSLVIMLLPKFLAERVVVLGYQQGVVLAATRVVSRPPTKIFGAGALAAAGALAICLAA
jgi:hypothetical protein